MDRDLSLKTQVELQSLMDTEGLSESSDDSDFRIEDHEEDEEEESEDDSVKSGDISTDSDNEKQDQVVPKSDIRKKLENLKENMSAEEIDEEFVKKCIICSVCLGDGNDQSNEIMECDGCGVTVHEGCYGVQESISVASAGSECDTEPWFCEACRAGVTNPVCELCPNKGGVFKETNVGKWVHLVCALYTPNVNFQEVDALNNVTLFDLPANRWGLKQCQFCDDRRFSRTGVTIECDAGMCRTYFHVTCAQKEGLLSDAPPEDLQADPYYAHCMLHSDKEYRMIKRRNWNALQLRKLIIDAKRKEECANQTPNSIRNQRKLTRYKEHYLKVKSNRPPAMIPKQKVSRMITTSASACRELLLKSELMGHDTSAHDDIEDEIAAMRETPKKWHIPPSFSAEFLSYFKDRELKRVDRLEQQESSKIERKQYLINEIDKLKKAHYEQIELEHEAETEKNTTLKNEMKIFSEMLLKFRPRLEIPNLDTIGMTPSAPAPAPPPAPAGAQPQGATKCSVPTVAALKAGVGFPIRLSNHSVTANINIKQDISPIKLNQRCYTCHESNEPHLMVKCDTCKSYYHLKCLEPPLTRMPKKTKQVGWQCSECDNSVSSSDQERVDTNAPRRLRYEASTSGADLHDDELEDYAERGERKKKKRRRGRHSNRYSPDYIPSKKRRKTKATPVAPDPNAPRQGIKLFIKSVPNPPVGGSALTSARATTSTFVSKTEEYNIINASASTSEERQKTTRVVENKCEKCSACNEVGTNLNMVRCDECLKHYHFYCLDPPVKKTPKVRGYSWHCADCDPTDTDTT